MTPTQREAALRLAMRKAFGLGQTYWQQADSESYSQNAKAEVTAKKFADLADETCAALLRELLAEPVINHKMTTEPAEPCFNLPALDAARELTRKA